MKKPFSALRGLLCWKP